MQTLRSQGYHVLEADNGHEALRLAAAYERPIHLLMTDVVMPQMYGKELAKQLRALRPETRILYVSGYTDTVMLHQGMPNGDAQFLQKPYTFGTLVSKVREVLDAER